MELMLTDAALRDVGAARGESAAGVDFGGLDERHVPARLGDRRCGRRVHATVGAGCGSRALQGSELNQDARFSVGFEHRLRFTCAALEPANAVLRDVIESPPIGLEDPIKLRTALCENDLRSFPLPNLRHPFTHEQLFAEFLKRLRHRSRLAP